MSNSANPLNNKQIKILEDLLNDINIYIAIHDRSAQYFNYYNNVITIPSIVLSITSGTITTIFGSSDNDDDEKSSHTYNVILGILMILAGCLTTLGRYLKYDIKNRDHLNLSSDFYSLKYEIKEYLSKPDDVKDDGTLFISNIIIKHCNLIKNNIEIPDKILNKYINKLSKDNTHGLDDENENKECKYRKSITSSSPKTKMRRLTSDLNNKEKQEEKVTSDSELQKKFFNAMERNIETMYLKRYQFAKNRLNSEYNSPTNKNKSTFYNNRNSSDSNNSNNSNENNTSNYLNENFVLKNNISRNFEDKNDQSDNSLDVNINNSSLYKSSDSNDSNDSNV